MNSARRHVPLTILTLLSAICLLNVIPSTDLEGGFTPTYHEAFVPQDTDDLEVLAAEHGSRKIRHRYGFYLTLRAYVKHHQLIVAPETFVNTAEALGFARAEVVEDGSYDPHLTASEVERLERHVSTRGEFVDGTPYVVVGTEGPSDLREFRFEGTTFFVATRYTDA